MKKSFIVLLHIGFWIITLFAMLLLAGMAQEANSSDHEYLYYLELVFGFFFIPCFCAFYSFYSWLFPKYLQKEKWLGASFFSLLLALGAASVGGFFLVYVSTIESSFKENCMQEGLIASLIISLFCGFIALIIKGFITWFEEIKLKESLKQKTHEMEMALVKAQLDPHFLFNTINNIDVLILKNAQEASNYLNKLSDIMRFMLFETKTEEIALSKEVEYIEKYIELQKIRTANQDYVSFSITGNLEEKKIAPMVFIPFIENAFKHTNNKKLKNAINICIEIGKETIKLFCENKLDPTRKSNGNSNGLGNDLIQKRLNLIYPEKHKLEITRQNNLYSVNLIINNG